MELIQILHSLLHLSKDEAVQAFIGVLTGALGVTALALFAQLHRFVLLALAIVLCSYLYEYGVGEFVKLADCALAGAIQHPNLMNGVLIGKVLTAFFWFGHGGRGTREGQHAITKHPDNRCGRH